MKLKVTESVDRSTYPIGIVSKLSAIGPKATDINPNSANVRLLNEFGASSPFGEATKFQYLANQVRCAFRLQRIEIRSFATKTQGLQSFSFAAVNHLRHEPDCQSGAE